MSERHEAEETRGRKAIASDTMNVVRNERIGHKGVFVSISCVAEGRSVSWFALYVSVDVQDGRYVERSAK